MPGVDIDVLTLYATYLTLNPPTLKPGYGLMTYGTVTTWLKVKVKAFTATHPYHPS
jgi:hypothetical protein